MWFTWVGTLCYLKACQIGRAEQQSPLCMVSLVHSSVQFAEMTNQEIPKSKFFVSRRACTKVIFFGVA